MNYWWYLANLYINKCFWMTKLIPTKKKNQLWTTRKYHKQNGSIYGKESPPFIFLSVQNRIGVTAGRCFNPLISPSIFCTPFLLLNGDTNLVASLEGEKDRRNFDAVDIFGDFLLKLVCLVGERETTGGLLILTWNLEEADGGDLIKNLCGVCLFLAITGDLVLQNFCCCAEAVDKNKGLGNRTVFLPHGLFLGDILFAKYRLFSLSKSLIFGGETLKLIRERALWSDGVSDSDRINCNLFCFSLFLLVLSSVFSGWGLWFLRWVTGVLGSSSVIFLDLLTTAATISLANWLACRISPTVSPTSIAGNDILRHSSVCKNNKVVTQSNQLVYKRHIKEWQFWISDSSFIKTH